MKLTPEQLRKLEEAYTAIVQVETDLIAAHPDEWQKLYSIRADLYREIHRLRFGQ